MQQIFLIEKTLVDFKLNKLLKIKKIFCYFIFLKMPIMFIYLGFFNNYWLSKINILITFKIF